MESARLFTIGDAGYFVGVVALVNSVRAAGNAQPITVLDLGFTPEQRVLLAPHCELVEAPRDRHPHLTKVYAPMRSDASVVVLVDSDVIVTGSLDALVDEAIAGAVVAAPDPVNDRFFGEWSEIFGLRSALHREVYVNSGLLAFSRERFPDLLLRWSELCEGMVNHPVLDDAEAGVNDPVWLPDQDALNALLMSEVAPGSIQLRTDVVMGHDSLRATRVVRERPLRCAQAGVPVGFLHAIGSPKPWHPRARWEYRPDVFVQCLRRLLHGPDLAIRVPHQQVPTWLRPGVPSLALRGVLRVYEAPARWSRPLRRRLRMSPLRRRDGYVPGRG